MKKGKITKDDKKGCEKIPHEYSEETEEITKKTQANTKRKKIATDDVLNAICSANIFSKMQGYNLPFELNKPDVEGISMKILFFRKNIE